MKLTHYRDLNEVDIFFEDGLENSVKKPFLHLRGTQ